MSEMFGEAFRLVPDRQYLSWFSFFILNSYIVRKIPRRRKWQPTPVFLLGEFHEQRSLAGYNPWGRKELTQLSDSLTLDIGILFNGMLLGFLKTMCFKCFRWLQMSTDVHRAFLVAVVKNSPAVRETQVQSLGYEDPLEECMTTHSNILAWRIPWTEEPGRLQFIGLQSQT